MHQWIDVLFNALYSRTRRFASPLLLFALSSWLCFAGTMSMVLALSLVMLTLPPSPRGDAPSSPVTPRSSASALPHGGKPNPSVYGAPKKATPKKPVELGVKDAIDPLTFVLFLGEEVSRTRKKRKGTPAPYGLWEYDPLFSCGPDSGALSLLGVCDRGTYWGPLHVGTFVAALTARDFFGLAQLSAVYSVTGRNFYGLAQASLGLNKVGGSFNGLFQAGLMNDVWEDFRGLVQFGLVNRAGNFFGVAQVGAVNTAGHATGLQLGLSNNADGMWGVQIGLIYNDGGTAGGITIAPLNFHASSWGLKVGLLTASRSHHGGILVGMMNFLGTSSGITIGLGNLTTHSNGLVIGMINAADKSMNGLSIGLINYADHVRGVQIGVINYADKLSGVQIGLINAADKGGLPVMIGLNMGFYKSQPTHPSMSDLWESAPSDQ